MSYVFRMTLGLVLALLSVPSLSLAQSIEISEVQPTEKVEQRLVLRDAAGQPLPRYEIDVTYYPATELSRREHACTTDEAGSCLWTPRIAGIVELQGAGIQKVVSVRYDGLPPTALMIFLIAGSVLFGGLTFTLFRIFRHQKSEDA